jgi:hypothetical protein
MQAARRQRPEVVPLSAEEAYNTLCCASSTGLWVVDFRTKKEFRSGHVECSSNLPLKCLKADVKERDATQEEDVTRLRELVAKKNEHGTVYSSVLFILPHSHESELWILLADIIGNTPGGVPSCFRIGFYSLQGTNTTS